MKKLVKPIILVFILLFLGLYFFYNNGYRESLIKKEQQLIEEKIKEYEEDLKEGIDVSQKDYTIPKPDYSNQYTKTSLIVGKTIEDLLSGGIRIIFRRMNDIVNEKK